MDPIAVVDGVLKRLEQHDAHSAAEDGAVGSDVERPAVPGRRDHRSRLVEVPHVVRHPEGGPTSQGHLALPVQNALAGQVHGDQRRRARRLHRERGPPKVELMRDAGRQVVLVVLQRQVDHVEARALADDHLRVVQREQVVQQIPAGGAGTEDPDGRLDLGRVVAGVLDGVERGLQEEPVLWIHGPGGLRGEAEEVGVELVDPRHQRRAPHVGPVGERLLADTCTDEFVLGQVDDRFLAAPQVPPERSHGVGAREPARHSDDRNRAGRQVGTAAHCRCPAFRRVAARCRAAARCCARSRTALGRSPGSCSTRPSCRIRSTARSANEAP